MKKYSKNKSVALEKTLSLSLSAIINKKMQDSGSIKKNGCVFVRRQ